MPIRAPHKGTSYVTAVCDLARNVLKLCLEAGPECCPPRPVLLGVRTPRQGPRMGARPVWPSRRQAGGETHPGLGAWTLVVRGPVTVGARSAPGGPTDLWLKQQKLALPRSQGPTSETEASLPQGLWRTARPHLRLWWQPASPGSGPHRPGPAATFTWLPPHLHL